MDYFYNYWYDLSLVGSYGRPEPDKLIALHLIPKNSQPVFYEEQYDIGQFRLDKTSGRKLWWHGTHGQRDPVRMKKNYDIRWAYVTADPIGKGNA